MLQRLCKQDLGWDEEIGVIELAIWRQWLLDRVKVEHMSVPRSLRPSDVVKLTTCQLHGFSDTSDEGYGIAIYARLEDSSSRVFCNMLMGKSRVDPLKKVTIPRMELTAGSLSVKFVALITSAMELNFYVNYWTDSTSDTLPTRRPDSKPSWQIVSPPHMMAPVLSRGGMSRLQTTQHT